jgi:predicted RNase H-like nuclease (RuvC/YqgF family)
VGTNFKIGFFKRSLSFCYDQKEGIVYSSDLAILNKLKVDKSKIIEIDTCRTTIEKVEKDVDQLKREKVLLERTINELVEFYKELLQISDEKENNQNVMFSTLKNSIGILNKKIKEESSSIENMNLRLEAVIEMLSEHAARSGQLPNVFRNDMTLEKIWNTIQDKNSAAVFSIMFMVKKALEDKGLRLS